MPDIVIADTTCLIILFKINQLPLLTKLYNKIYTTPEIAAEYGEVLPSWVLINKVEDSQKQRLLELQVDKGEASAIALALEMNSKLLIVDDNKARTLARQLNITFTGTLGVIIKAKVTGLIPSIKPLLKEIQLTDFRLSQSVIDQALQLAGESN